MIIPLIIVLVGLLISLIGAAGFWAIDRNIDGEDPDDDNHDK